MAMFGLKISRRKKSTGTFHVDTLSRQPNKKKPFSLGRVFGSALTLSVGGFLCYTALHYVPAYVSTAKILSFSNVDTSATRLASHNNRTALRAWRELFTIRRAFVRAGQTIQVQYALPEGTELQLVITQCERAFIIAVFKCVPVSSQTIKIAKKTIGTREFVFDKSGFYDFDDIIIQKSANVSDYQVIWRRS